MVILANFISAGCNRNHSSAPPVAKKIPHVTQLNGEQREDDYFWLREKSNPEVRAYLDAENRYADAIMAPTQGFQELLYKEMLSHIKETDVKVPYREGDYFYYSRTEEGKQYPIYCRKKESLNAAEAIILDQNELAKNENFMNLGIQVVSDNGRLLAYSTDNTGFRQYRLQIKNLETGQIFPETVEKTGSVVWAADNRTFFYTVEDAAKRQYRVCRHQLGTPVSADAMVYEEKDERFDVSLSRSLSRRFIFLLVGSHTTSEVRYLSASQPAGEWQLVAPRVPGQEYYVDHCGDLFYIRTNKDGRNFEVATAPLSNPDREQWKVLIPHRPEVMIEDMNLFANHLVLWLRQDGLQQIMIRDLRQNKDIKVSFPDAAYDLAPGPNREFQTEKVRYQYQSPITPETTYDYDISRHESILLKQREVPGGFDRRNYRLERIFATAPDGAKVPVTVFSRRDVPQNGTAPLYLYGYGSYGYPTAAIFSNTRLSMLDRSVVVALAHIRGGGELGKAWHEDGRMSKKMNTFTDFIAVAEHLIAEKYCARDKIAIEGRSAGGLLMGAVTNMRPELWRVVLAQVPFVDVINTMADASLPLTVGEYEEWGNPAVPQEYAVMRQYSPYDNIQAKAYPTMLVKTSFNDSQVMCWEPAKYVAKLRALKTDKNLLLFKTNMEAGHGGSSGRYDHLKEYAYDYAFILTQLGISK